MNRHGPAPFPRDDLAAHPSIDQIADHLEGLLDAGEERAVAAHLMACSGCGEIPGRLVAVSAALRQKPDETMPPDVIARVDAALARAADVERAGASQPMRPRHRRWAPRILSAAAALALVVIGYTATSGSGGDDATNAQTAGSARESAARPESAAGGVATDPDTLSRASVAPGDIARARRSAERLLAGSLSATADSAPTAPSGDATAGAAPGPLPSIAGLDRGSGGTEEGSAGALESDVSDCGDSLARRLSRTIIGVSDISWGGRPAQLVVLTGPDAADARTAEAIVVRDCDDGPGEALYALTVNTP